jgi:hypothetical protein
VSDDVPFTTIIWAIANQPSLCEPVVAMAPLNIPVAPEPINETAGQRKLSGQRLSSIIPTSICR